MFNFFLLKQTTIYKIILFSPSFNAVKEQLLLLLVLLWYWQAPLQRQTVLTRKASDHFSKIATLVTFASFYIIICLLLDHVFVEVYIVSVES